jgi:hypothetical protein
MKTATATSIRSFPPDAMAALCALEEKIAPDIERRNIPRKSYNVPAQVDVRTGKSLEEQAIFTHSVHSRAVGFVCAQPFTPGQRATIHLGAPDGRQVHTGMTITRCRQLINGWFEVAADFHRAQVEFAEFSFAEENLEAF